jgi:hypothetical protein
LKWKQSTTNAARYLSDLASEPGIAQHPANAASYQSSKWCSKQSTEQALRCELLSAVSTQLRNPIHVVSCMLIENGVIKKRTPLRAIFVGCDRLGK